MNNYIKQEHYILIRRIRKEIFTQL